MKHSSSKFCAVTVSLPVVNCHPAACFVQALVGDRLREAYRSGSSKQQRAQLVAPLWEEARQALVGDQQHGSSGNGTAAAAEQEGITALDVDKALKVSKVLDRNCC